MLKSSFAHKRNNSLNKTPAVEDAVRIFVGQEGREFVIPKKLLASTSPYFHQRLDTSSISFVHRDAQLNVLWLEDACPNMFDLFTYWLYKRNNFQALIDEAQAEDWLEDLLWDLVKLHLFAARIEVDPLQDITMDAIQDIHLFCNWDLNLELASYVYNECNADDSCRIRKWIVAMTAWSHEGDLKTVSKDHPMHDLFDTCPEFNDDYVAHMSKVSKNRIKLQFKNPQLRLPTNDLRNEERQFGFRQCTFHTHRSRVGQGQCPHTIAVSRIPARLDGGLVSPTTAIFDLYLDQY